MACVCHVSKCNRIILIAEIVDLMALVTYNIRISVVFDHKMSIKFDKISVCLHPG